MNTDIIIIQNYWQTHYKIMLFNALHEIFPHFKVLYLAEIAKMREYKTNREELNFPHDVLFIGEIDDINPLRAALAIHRRLNHYDPKIVVIGGYNYFFYWVTFVWARKKKKKLIIINESHFLDKPRSKIKESIKKLFVSKCDAALVDGTRHRDYTVGLGLESEKIFIKQGPGPIDVPFYKRQVSRFRGNKHELCYRLGIARKNFLFVGRFSPEKNILFLTRVYERLKKGRAKDWGLILVGNGPQREEIESFVSKNKIKDIFLPGFKQQEELPFFYAI
nr:glycosyltransferase [Candidatus Aenigmarchaeota archaeon]